MHGITEPAGQPSKSVAIQLTTALLYGTVAVAMSFVNKFTMQIFPLTNVIIVFQMVFTWAILQPLIAMKVLTFPSFRWSKARQLLWVSMLYTGNTAFALIGLKTLNIPMYNVLKRLTPVIILVVKALIRKRWPSRPITLSVLLVVAGCLVAGAGDLTFDLMGYCYALASCLSQAGYLLTVEFQGADNSVSTSELLYYNSITSLPLLAVIVLVTGEASSLPEVFKQACESAGSITVVSTVLSCSLMGVLLNYSLFLCTNTNSALTTTMVGVFKGIIAVILGFFLLGGVPFGLINVTGIAMNTAGGVWYTYIKFKSKVGELTPSTPLPEGEREPLLPVSVLGGGVTYLGQDGFSKEQDSELSSMSKGLTAGMQTLAATPVTLVEAKGSVHGGSNAESIQHLSQRHRG